jgi:hypothetical protein
MNNYTYNSKEQCEHNSNINLNPKFKTFKQFVFTCGDKEDLKKKLIKPRKLNLLKQVNLSNQITKYNILELANYTKKLFVDYPLYKNISQENSFRSPL